VAKAANVDQGYGVHLRRWAFFDDSLVDKPFEDQFSVSRFSVFRFSCFRRVGWPCGG